MNKELQRKHLWKPLPKQGNRQIQHLPKFPCISLCLWWGFFVCFFCFLVVRRLNRRSSKKIISSTRHFEVFLNSHSFFENLIEKFTLKISISIVNYSRGTTSLIECFVFKYSVQFSRSAVSDSLWPHGLQHARLPCPSPTPGAYSNSCPLRWWC